VSDDNLIEVQALTKHYAVGTGSFGRFGKSVVHAVDGVDMQIRKGETLGLVGESGCGKSTLGRCILRLIEPTSGRVVFNAQDITALRKGALRRLRRHMQIVFQDPFSSLDPRMTVEAAIGQPFDVFGVPGGQPRHERVRELLEAVGLDASSLQRFPHQFSGGQRQRIAIARALALNPQFIVADEPVSALDVSIRAQILNLLKELKSRFALTYLYISHDLSTVKFISDRVAVMYLGKLVEIGPARTVFAAPKHPYTRALIDAVPVPDPAARNRRQPMKGEPPSPISPPSGCRFHPRCPKAMPVCKQSVPLLRATAEGDYVACHLYADPAVVGDPSAAAQTGAAAAAAASGERPRLVA
jgi:oligopeptide transport system ATP-binding protein